MCAKRIEPLEYKPAVIAEELMHADHTQQYDRIIIIPLNSLALASRTPHRTILADVLRYNVDGAIEA